MGNGGSENWLAISCCCDDLDRNNLGDHDHSSLQGEFDNKNFSRNVEIELNKEKYAIYQKPKCTKKMVD